MKDKSSPNINVRIGTENRYVAGFSIYRNSIDAKTLVPHLDNPAEKLDRQPENIVVDSGYGSEENYEY